MLLMTKHLDGGFNVIVVDRQMPGRNILRIANIGELIRAQRFAVDCLGESGHEMNLWDAKQRPR